MAARHFSFQEKIKHAPPSRACLFLSGTAGGCHFWMTELFQTARSPFFHDISFAMIDDGSFRNESHNRFITGFFRFVWRSFLNDGRCPFLSEWGGRFPMTVIGQRQRSPFGMTVIELSFRKENQICYGFAADLSAHLSFRNDWEDFSFRNEDGWLSYPKEN